MRYVELSNELYMFMHSLLYFVYKVSNPIIGLVEYVIVCKCMGATMPFYLIGKPHQLSSPRTNLNTKARNSSQDALNQSQGVLCCTS